MKVYKGRQWTGGWFIGNFEPTALKTENFEVCLKRHPKGERWPKHYHKIATEINYLISGKMTLLGKTLIKGDVFVIEPGEIADPEFQEDCEIVVVKIPSVKNDKYKLD